MARAMYVVPGIVRPCPPIEDGSLTFAQLGAGLLRIVCGKHEVKKFLLRMYASLDID